MEMSNVQRIQSFSFAFDEAVQAERIVPPLEDWGNKPYALDIATQMKDLGKGLRSIVKVVRFQFTTKVTVICDITKFFTDELNDK